MKKYFVTSTGTGIGKTLITSAFAWQLCARGKSVRALKPVISGFDATKISESDTGQLLLAQGIPVTEADCDAISPWRFKAALSPDIAAEEEGNYIDFDGLIDFCEAQSGVDYLFIEGVGGVMVPLGEGVTTLDWMAALKLPVILVAGSYLGAISHTLTACAAVLSRGLTLHSVILSESDTAAVPVSRLKAHIQPFLPQNVPITCVTRLDSSPELWKYVPDITGIVL